MWATGVFSYWRMDVIWPWSAFAEPLRLSLALVFHLCVLRILMVRVSRCPLNGRWFKWLHDLFLSLLLLLLWGFLSCCLVLYPLFICFVCVVCFALFASLLFVCLFCFVLKIGGVQRVGRLFVFIAVDRKHEILLEGKERSTTLLA